MTIAAKKINQFKKSGERRGSNFRVEGYQLEAPTSPQLQVNLPVFVAAIPSPKARICILKSPENQGIRHRWKNLNLGAKVSWKSFLPIVFAVASAPTNRRQISPCEAEKRLSNPGPADEGSSFNCLGRRV